MNKASLTHASWLAPHAYITKEQEMIAVPIYEYRCQNCGTKNEALQKMGAGAEGLVCKACGSKELQKTVSAHCVGKSTPEAAHSCGSGGCCGGTCGI